MESFRLKIPIRIIRIEMFMLIRIFDSTAKVYSDEYLKRIFY